MSQVPCPVCSSKKTRCTPSMAPDIENGIAYVEPLVKVLNINLKEWRSQNKTYKCLNCFSSFINPWVKPSIARIYFSTVKHNHQSGWDQLEYALKGKRCNYYMSWIFSIFKKIENKGIRVAEYAEYGCPFSGFALNAFSQQSGDKIRKKVYRLFRPVESGSRWLQISHFFHKLDFFSFRLISTLSWLKKTHTKMDGAKMEYSRKTLIQANTSLGWGVNCTRFNNSCNGAALKLNMFDNFTQLEYIEKENTKFDMIGIFNYLDHLDKPLEHLDKLLQSTNYLIFTTHDSSQSGWQHQFGFSTEIVNYLQKIYADKFQVSIISKLMDKTGGVTDFAVEIKRLIDDEYDQNRGKQNE